MDLNNSNGKLIQKEQYVEYKADLRHFDIGLWAVPTAIFALTGGVVSLIVIDEALVKSVSSVAFLFIGFLASLSLYIVFEKYHKRKKELQKYVNRYEKENKIEQLRLFHRDDGLWFASAFFWMRVTILIVLLGYIACILLVTKSF